MRKYQRGIGLGGLLIGAVILIVLALVGFKVGPAYSEYFTIKKAVVAVAQEKQGATVGDIRKAYDARSAIDDLGAVKASDLEITKEGNEVVIAFGYRKEVPLFKNVGLYFDFAGQSKE
jgi:hypothetical protein